METRLYKYIENFTSKKTENFQIKTDTFYISVQNIDCGYSLEPPRENIDCGYSLEPPRRGGSNEYPQSMFLRGGSNEYPQSMFLSRNKKNKVHLCKPQFYYIKVGFKGVKII